MVDVTRVVLAVDSRQVRTASGDLDRLDSSGQKVNKTTALLGRAFAGLTAAMAVREIYRATEAWTTLNNRLRLVTDGAEQLAAAQADVFRIAQDTRQPLTATAELYQRIAMNQDALNLTSRELADVTQTISRTMVISGTSAQAAQAAMVQLGQAFASGTLRGEELNSVLEQAPALAQAIAAGMGVTVGQLHALGQEGTLTAESVIDALQRQGDAVEQQFSSMQMTIGQALTQAGNSFTQFIGQMDEATGASSLMAFVISDLSQGIDKLSAGVQRASNNFDVWLVNLGLADKEILDAYKNTESTAKATEEAAESTSEWAKSIKELRKELDPASKLMKEVNEEADKQIKRLGEILNKIYPQQAAVNRLADEWEFLKRTLEGVDGAQQVMSDWFESELPKPIERTNALADAIANSEEALQGVTRESEVWATAYERGIERMRDLTGDFFQKMIMDGEASFSDLGDLFKRMIAEMVATAASEQIFSVIKGNGLMPMGGGNMASLLAGAGGFAAGTAAFGQTSGIGALGGGFAASKLLSGLGPWGVALGAFGGTALESLFGGDNNGENAGRAQLNLRTGASNIGGVGNTFDQGRVDQVGSLAGFAQQVASLIGGSNANLDIVSGRSGIRVGANNFAAGDVQGALNRIFVDVVNQSGALTESMKRLLNSFKGTSDQALQFAEAMLSIDRMTQSNPIERLRESLTGPSSLASAYEQQIDTIRTLRANFDGSAVAAQEMSQALAANQSTAVQLAQALMGVSQQASSMFGSSAQSIRESVMSDQELRQSRFAERNSLFNSIGRVSDASELSRISQRINELNNAIFNSLRDPSREQAEQFASFAERASDRIEQRSERLIDNLARQQERQNRELQNMMRQAATQQQQAANTMLSAANILSGAASRFASAGFDTPNVVPA